MTLLALAQARLSLCSVFAQACSPLLTLITIFGRLRRSILNCFNSSRVGPELVQSRTLLWTALVFSSREIPKKHTCHFPHVSTGRWALWVTYTLFFNVSLQTACSWRGKVALRCTSLFSFAAKPNMAETAPHTASAMMSQKRGGPV